MTPRAMTPNAMAPSAPITTRATTVAVVAGVLTGSFLLAGGASAAPASAPAAAPAVAPAAAPAAAPAVASPVGKLAPTGCTGTGSAATCAVDLWAMAGTTSILGNAIPIWGFSATGAPGTATAPGPQLTVPQGAHVTITLHNGLAEPVSLALPGQASADLGTAGDDVNGAAPGATTTYAFTANRAGTFAYEAGHTSDGARQVAMGLAGAMVVVPPDGTAYGTRYDDDGVLVLSEIDPALNANPATFDMRSFKPAYRLINGKPFPSSDPVATDQGRTVVLRYVNVGSQTHAMGVLGRTQQEIAQDGHALTYPMTVATESIDPGETLDTVVTMPTGPDAKFAVYEAGQHLDNNGAGTADPSQVAFGGMMTFLDTNPPPPSNDGVGPVSTHIAVNPTPSNGQAPVTVTADLSDATTGGSAVSQAEFVVDDAVDTGVGYGVPMTGAFGTTTVVGATGTIPVSAPAGTTCDTVPTPVSLDCLSAGKHTVYVRAEDSANNWGVIGSAVLNLPKTGPQTTAGSATPSPANGTQDVAVSTTGDDSNAGQLIDGAEYFLDTAGANGSGTPLTLNRSATVVSEDVTIPAATVKALGEGVHHVLVHSHDSLGLWGPTLDVPLTVDLTGPTVDAASVGPNPSNGVIGDKAYPTSLVVSTQITDRDTGNALQSPLVAAEAFVDKTTGAPGSGLQLIAVDGKFDSTSEAAYGLIPLSQIKALADGDHQVYVRGKDAAGNWGALFGAKLLVDKKAPVLSAASATPNPTNGASTVQVSATVVETNTLSASEFWWGTTDPGVGKGSSVPVSVVNGKVVLTVPLAGVTPGVQQLNVRVKDLAGNWSNAVSTSVTVSKPNAVFSSTFELPAPTDWSARTGAVTNSAAAKVATPYEPATAQGLQAVVPTTGATRTAYVTDTTPTAETGYHVRFAFNRNTLTNGNAVNGLTLFDARSTNASVFSLQFRMNGAQPQVRTVFARSNFQAALTGAWVNLTAGARQIQLDWSAATAGSLTLKVDGATVQTLTGNDSTLRVETGLLGVSGALGSTSTGTAFFDSYTSTRVSLP